MALLPSNYSGNVGAPHRSPGGDGTSINLALDNMIRNQLKVSDPRNPKEIADALLKYYQDLPQAAGIRNEAMGLPFLQAPQPMAVLPPTATSSDREFSIANGDVERALTDLTTNALTNDIIPEMRGWADAIRNSITDGNAAARQGLDPRQRDQVMAIRRQLSEYARMARFVGTLAPGMTQNFRRLAQGLDEVGAVLLVMLGEALASVGFASGYYLLQVPVTELQSRRDSVIYALRNFMGGAQQAYGPDDWPRGVNAYRQLFSYLEEQGQGDLRSMLVENEIARSMDQLISRAQNGSAEGLRALGVTAQLDIERFRRLAIVAPGALNNVASPPLSAFLEALLLFADSFTPAGGLRLLRVARPPILFYGLYNVNSSGDGQLLLRLIALRGGLATLLDAIPLGSDTTDVVTQVLFDMLLSLFDRAIDLLAVGAEDDQGTVHRASAHFRLINAIIAVFAPMLLTQSLQQVDQDIAGRLTTEFGPDAVRDPGLQDAFLGGLRQQFLVPPLLQRWPATFFGTLGDLMRRYVALIAEQPAPFVASLAGGPDASVRGELRVQMSLESRWRDLVRTIAPDASGQHAVFAWLRLVVAQALEGAGRSDFSGQAILLDPLPPQYETSLANIAQRRPYVLTT